VSRRAIGVNIALYVSDARLVFANFATICMMVLVVFQLSLGFLQVVNVAAQIGSMVPSIVVPVPNLLPEPKPVSLTRQL
jgi:hypothetical protein